MDMWAYASGALGAPPVGDVPSWLVGRTLAGGGGEWRTIENVAVADFVAAKARPLRDLIIGIEPVQSGSGDPSPDNVRPISGWTVANIWDEATHDTAANPAVTIDLDGTRYGGTLDVRTGLLTVTMEEVDMGSLDWTYEPTYAYFKTNVPGARLNTSTGELSNIISSEYQQVAARSSSAWGSAPDKSMGCRRASSELFVVKDTSYTDKSTFKDAVRGVQLVYGLRTPLTYQLTPTEVASLLGQNYVWADTGDIIKLTYFGEASP